MDPNILNNYHQFQLLNASCNNTATVYLSQLWKLVYNSHQQTRYSKPMPWIGIYIALASLYCVIAMVADLLHGFRNIRLWFPCKYFTLNAATLTVLGVAIKLPMDLTNLMPGYADQASKLGSLAFMCTMMANLLPSLATMDSKEIFTNMIALGVLVITLVVDVCIQINTGVLSYHVIDDAELFNDFYQEKSKQLSAYIRGQSIRAIFFVFMLLILLIIYACSSLAILTSKQILESKYQAAHRTALKDQELQQQGRLLTVEKLKQHVSNHWIMARTGSPQFMTTCSLTTPISGFICIYSTCIHIVVMPFHIKYAWDYNSDYKWSMSVIFMIQFIGVILGTIAPVARCCATRSFKISSIWNHIKVSTVESYWTQKLSDWKKSSISLPSCSRKWKILVENLKILILSICIVFQKVVVVVCKMMMVLLLCIPICISACLCFWKWLKAKFSPLDIVLVQNAEQVEKNKYLSRYVLQLQEDVEFTELTLKCMLRSVNDLIQKAEKQQPKNLMRLLAKSLGFEGVEKFDSHCVLSLLSEEYLNCWSLPLVTMTTIAMSIPNIQKNLVDGLMSGVSEGLVYATLVEESLNASDDHLSIQKATKTLWVEVEVYHKWLGNKLQKRAPQTDTAGQILQWLSDTATSMVTEVKNTDIGGRTDNSNCKSISANSMYRITETILLSYDTNNDELSHEELFEQLSSMIADILAACLTNLPKVIAMKCHTSAIEKREANVEAAAQLLGETTQIINTLQQRELPSLDPDELAYIEKWRAYLMDPFP